MAQAPLIFAVKRASIDDGEGIRTVFFLKGCPLRCSWCHNPESWNAHRNITLDPSRCLDCGRCRRACAKGALSQAGPLSIRANLCRRCAVCAQACISGALQSTGLFYEHDALYALAREDQAFYAVSGGGVTFSGGEPLLYAAYLGRAAARLRAEGISVCVQTCGEFNYAAFQRYVAQHIDTVYFDIKLADSKEHALHTGRSNRRILDNLARMVRDGVKLVPRTPLIPGISDTPKNLEGIALLLKKLGLHEAHVLLPWNAAGKRPVLTLV